MWEVVLGQRVDPWWWFLVNRDDGPGRVNPSNHAWVRVSGCDTLRTVYASVEVSRQPRSCQSDYPGSQVIG